MRNFVSVFILSIVSISFLNCTKHKNTDSEILFGDAEQNIGQKKMEARLGMSFLESYEYLKRNFTNGKEFVFNPSGVNVSSTYTIVDGHRQQTKDFKETNWILGLSVHELVHPDPNKKRFTYDRYFDDYVLRVDKELLVPFDLTQDSLQSRQFKIGANNEIICTLSANIQYIDGSGKEIADPTSTTKPSGGNAVIDGLPEGYHQLNYVRVELTNNRNNPIVIPEAHSPNPSIEDFRNDDIYMKVRLNEEFNSPFVVKELVKNYTEDRVGELSWTNKVSFEFGNNPFYTIGCTPKLDGQKRQKTELSIDEAMKSLEKVGVFLTNRSEVGTGELNPRPTTTSCEEKLQNINPTIPKEEARNICKSRNKN